MGNRRNLADDAGFESPSIINDYPIFAETYNVVIVSGNFGCSGMSNNQTEKIMGTRYLISTRK